MFQHLKHRFSQAWSSLLNRLARRRMRATLWYAQRVMDVRRAYRPGLGMLTDKQAEVLAELVESPYWAPLQAYLEIERVIVRDNALVHANDLLQLGEVKGDIGRCNKIENDIIMLFHERQEQRKAEGLQKDLAQPDEEEQDAAV